MYFLCAKVIFIGLYLDCTPPVFLDRPYCSIFFPVKNWNSCLLPVSKVVLRLWSHLPLHLILKFDNPYSKSKSIPQEQKPFEVKPAPFVRSRFKRPKPNLARATLKRETTEAGKYVPGKKLETDKAETVVLQQSSEQMNTLPSQHVSAVEGGGFLF